MSPSIPNLPSSAVIPSYSAEGKVRKLCGSVLSPPAGYDEPYSCPKAGLYNIETTFSLFGTSYAWYGSYYGFNMGISIDIEDTKTDQSYATCYAEIKVEEGTASPSTDWAFFVGGGVAALSGMAAAGYMRRKRRVTELKAADNQSEECTSYVELAPETSSSSV